MCGRYTLESDMEFLQQRFKFAISEPDYTPRYNIAPTQDVLTVTNNGERHGQFMRWGLVPFWAKDLKIGSTPRPGLWRRRPPSGMPLRSVVGWRWPTALLLGR